MEEVPLIVVKRSGMREPFDRGKVIDGLRSATKNRPVPESALETMAREVEEELRELGPAPTSEQVGLAVLDRLRTVDEVAYLRFASVYKGFEGAEDFRREVGLLTKAHSNADELGAADGERLRWPSSSTECPGGPLPSTPIPTIRTSPVAARWPRGPRRAATCRCCCARTERRGRPTPPPMPASWPAGGRPRPEKRQPCSAWPARRRSDIPTASSTTTSNSAGNWWRPSVATDPRWCWPPTQRRCSSGRSTSIIGITGWWAWPCSTPWHPAALPLYFPDAGPAHQVGTVLLSGTLEPDVWIDISSTIEVKGEAVACHRSQFPDGGDWASAAVHLGAEDAGRQCGVPYAEAFRRLQLGG